MEQRHNKYPKISGIFWRTFSLRANGSFVHVYHTFHHVLTIPKTTFATLFFQNTLLKRWLNSKTPDRSGVLFF
jgi:hypothetical protein